MTLLNVPNHRRVSDRANEICDASWSRTASTIRPRMSSGHLSKAVGIALRRLVVNEMKMIMILMMREFMSRKGKLI